MYEALSLQGTKLCSSHMARVVSECQSSLFVHVTEGERAQRQLY